MRSRAVVVLLFVAVVVVPTGCQTTNGTPVADKSGVASSSTVTTRHRTSTTTTPSSSVASAPLGPPVGRATIQVLGAGPVTIRYRINGDAERTERNVTPPWEKQYDVYDAVETTVSADGGDGLITCSIMMDGNLVSYTSEPRPTCSFAYYG